MEARRKLGELLEGVYYRGDEVIIERGGKPMAAVLPIERLQAIDAARHRLGELLDDIHSRLVDPPLSEEEAMELALEGQRWARRQLEAEKSKAKRPA
jgi:prevent-host-death family protein